MLVAGWHEFVRLSRDCLCGAMRAEPDRKQNDGAGEVQHIVRDVDLEDSQEHRKRWRAGGLSQVGYSWGRGSSPNFAHAASYNTTISRRISGRSEIGPDHGTVTDASSSSMR